MQVILLLLLFLVGCFHEPALEPTTAPLQEMAEEAPTPQRAASMRLVDQGRIELNASHFEKAATQFSKAIEVDSTNAYAYFYLALVRFQQGRFAPGGDLFARAATLFTREVTWKAESLAYRGECLEKLQKLDLALKSFEKGLQVDPKNQRAKDGMVRLGKTNG